MSDLEKIKLVVAAALLNGPMTQITVSAGTNPRAVITVRADTLKRILEKEATE